MAGGCNDYNSRCLHCWSSVDDVIMQESMPSLDNKTVEVFLKLLRAGLWEKEVRLSDYGDIDFAEIYRLAEYHSITGLIAAGLEKVSDVRIPQNYALTFAGAALQIEQRNRSMNKFLARIINQLRSAGIYALLVKGQGVAQYYAKPLWRVCGDIDLFLSDDNYKKAQPFLRPLASAIEAEEKYKKHIGYTIDNWVVELHGNLYSSLSRRVEKGLDKIYNETFFGGSVISFDMEGVHVFLLNPENNIIYVFTHILQHYFHGGIGLRQICDWCRLLYVFNGKVDLQSLALRLRSMGILSEWKSFAYMAVNDLGMDLDSMPLYEDSGKWKQKAYKVMTYILESGNFGHRDMRYVKESSYLGRKVHSTSMLMKHFFRHLQVFPLDTIRFFTYYLCIRTQALIRGE